MRGKKKKPKKRDDADLALSQGSVLVACEANKLHMYDMSAMFCQEVNDVSIGGPSPKGKSLAG